MNNIIKILTIIVILLIILSSNILATSASSVKDIFDQAEDWTETGKKQAEKGMTMDTSELKKVSSLIFNILFGAGIAVAVIVGAFLGIQFMTAGIDEKVEVKKALPAYIVSCIVLFGAYGIWKLIVTILASLE